MLDIEQVTSLSIKDLLGLNYAVLPEKITSCGVSDLGFRVNGNAKIELKKR